MSKAAEIVQSFRMLHRALASVDSFEGQIAAGRIKRSPADRDPRPMADAERAAEVERALASTDGVAEEPRIRDAAPRLVYSPVVCPVPGCGRQFGWSAVDPLEVWETEPYARDHLPIFPTPSAYSGVFAGMTCTPCAEASNRARWLRHVLRDIVFQHSEAAKIEARFVSGPPESDDRWFKFKTELALIAPTANRLDAFVRRVDVLKDKSFRAYKAHFFSFLNLRGAVFNPVAKSNLDGPDHKHDGALHDDAKSLANTVSMAIWSYEQLKLEGSGCLNHQDRDEGCVACKSTACGVRPEHVDSRWRRLADIVCRGRPLLEEMQRMAVLVADGHRFGASSELDDILRRGNDRNDRERVAYARAFRVLWVWNRQHDRECLELAQKNGAVA